MVNGGEELLPNRIRGEPAVQQLGGGVELSDHGL